MTKLTTAFLLSTLLFRALIGEPRFAVESGASCNLCHINPTGGGLRNDYGLTIFALEDLPLKGLTQYGNTDWTGVIEDHLRIGGDFRVQSLIRAPSDSKVRLPIFPMQAAIYLNFTLGNNLSLYYKQSLSNGSGNEYWLLVEDLPGDTWLKIGKSLPDYGLKLSDHTAYIRGGNLRLTNGLEREGLFFAPPPWGDLPGLVELGTVLTPGLYFTGSIANGIALGHEAGYGISEAVRDKAVTTKLSYVYTRNGRLGLNLNISHFSEANLRGSGFSGGVSIRQFSWLFEADRFHNWVSGTSTLAVHHELSCRFTQGIYGLLKYDFFDPDEKMLSGALTRYTLGTEIFLTSSLGLIAELRLNAVETLQSPDPSPDLLLQLHAGF